MVKVQINNWKDKIYFIEQRMDNKLMEVSGMPSYSRLEYADDVQEYPDKSLIYTSKDLVYEEEEYLRRLRTAIQNDGISNLEDSPIEKHYLGLNALILSQNSDDISNFFDLEYITNYEALRTVSAFTQHGWYKDNFHIFLDRSSGKFYPTITDDDNPNFLHWPGLDPIEKQLNHFNASNKILDYSLFISLTKNDHFRQKKYKKIQQIINEFENTFLEDILEIRKLNESIYSYGYLAFLVERLNLEKKDLYKKNIDILRRYLAFSSPEIHASVFNGGAKFVITPNSMSMLGLSRFALNNLDPNKIIPLKVSINNADQGTYNIFDGNIGTDEKGILNITNVLDSIRLYDRIDDHSSKITNEYVILIESDIFNAKQNNNIGLDIILNNLITNKELSSNTEIKKDVYQESFDSSIINFDPSMASYDLEEFHRSLSEINYEINDENELIINLGDYELTKDLIIPDHLSLIVETGVTLRLGAGVALISKNDFYIKGTSDFPVNIIALDENKPFGSVGIIGDGNNQAIVKNLYLKGGSERWFRGAYLSGGMSIHYANKVNISDSIFSFNKGDDGINLKYINNAIISKSKFYNNAIDQIDIDNSNAIIEDSTFETVYKDPNSDGIDFSGSNIILKNSSLIGFDDKGISVGEKSIVIIKDNIIENNRIGMHQKITHRFFLKIISLVITKLICIFMKKPHFGGSQINIYSRNRKGLENFDLFLM